jgi:hypothetical protein
MNVMRHRSLSFTTSFTVALFILVLVNVAHAARLAVVIGNDQYQYHPKLRKAGNDADAMAALLKRAGFTVVNDGKRRDLTGIQITQALGRLVDAVHEGDEVVVFYSGHGLQYGDVSILTGTDLPSPAERYVALHSGIQLKQWQNRIQAQRARFALFVVDACREDLTDDGVVRSVNLGADTIAVAPPPKGQLVIYSASSGQFALDRLGNADPNPNGVFTRVFLEEAQKPGVSILDVLGETEERVQRLAATYVSPRSGRPHEQTPASRNEWSVRGKFCFFSQGGQCGVSAPAPSPFNDEDEAWSAAKRANTRSAYLQYKTAYPTGRYVRAADIAMEEFSPPVAPNVQPNVSSPESAALPAGLAKPPVALGSRGQDLLENSVLVARQGFTTFAGGLRAPGSGKQDYTTTLVRTQDLSRGTLHFEVTMGEGVSAGSFDVFPSTMQLPTEGRPRGSLGGAYDVAPKRVAKFRVPINGNEVLRFGASGNWASPRGTTNAYSVQVQFVPY